MPQLNGVNPTVCATICVADARKWQASTCCISHLTTETSPYLFLKITISLRRYSRRDLVGRLSSIPNGGGGPKSLAGGCVP